MLRANPPVRMPDFVGGESIVCDGIAFFVDPQDASTLYAASPSAEHSERRMNLIVSEAIRALPSLLAEYPDLHECISGRKLTIRMVENYASPPSRFRREVALEWDILERILSDAPDEKPEQTAGPRHPAEPAVRSVPNGERDAE